MNVNKGLVATIGIAALVVIGVACAQQPESTRPTLGTPSATSPTHTPTVAKKDAEKSVEVRVVCEMTEAASLEYPMLVARGVDPIPSRFDAVNAAGCRFTTPVNAVRLELHRDGEKVFAQEIILDPAVAEVRFPLTAEEGDAIPADLELGSYDRVIRVTNVDGVVKEVRSDTVWLLDPVSSPKDRAREALMAARRALYDSRAMAAATLVALEPVDWPNTSLGCPEPDMLYAQVITPGFRLVFEYEGQQYEYHTDQDGSTVVECEIEPTPDSGSAPDDTSQKIAQSQALRDTSPDVSQASLSQLTAGNTAFAFDLYQALSAEDGNLFYSPYSISLALAMTYAGARGETEQQMANTLHFILSQDRLHSAFNGLDLELAGRGEGAEGTDEEGFRLNIINALWGQEDFEFLAEFLDLVAENYGAGLRLLDFVNAADDSRIVINDWVSEQTEGKIEDLIPEDVINNLTRLVLTNAIFFNAAWLHPFMESQTKDGAFHLLDGGEVTVPMMRQTAGFGLAKGDGYQAVELPYDGNELSMVILLPDTGQFGRFEDSLDADLVRTITEGLVPTRVDLTMPKFEFESDFSLVDTLSTMGMPVAFISSFGPCTSEMADFSGMTGSCELFITEVVHKAFVSVDEAGTEAAAATAVVGGPSSVPPSVTIDRPFVFLIRDIGTGAILFVGRVADPSA